jgi:hypothetical protein
LSKWFQTRRFLWEFPIGSYVKLSSDQTKNRKKGDEIKKKSSPLKLLSQSQPSFVEMILGWSSFDRKAEPADTFLEENHPMTISSTKISD